MNARRLDFHSGVRDPEGYETSWNLVAETVPSCLEFIAGFRAGGLISSKWDSDASQKVDVPSAVEFNRREKERDRVYLRAQQSRAK